MTEGLTERHKQRTRRELAGAAARLFLERGYTATTVQDIADAADVSARTFFRYFPSKEDIVTAIVGSGTDDVIEHLAAHPEHIVLGEAFRHSLLTVPSQVRADLDASRAFRQMLRSTPSLRGRWLEEQRRNRDRIADALGPWFEDPAERLPRQLAAGLAQLAIEAALDLWADDPSIPEPQGLLDEALSYLDGPLLARRRRGGPSI